MSEANFRIRLSVGGVSEVTSALNGIKGVASSVGSALTSLAGIAGITTGLAGMAAAIGKSVSFNAQLEQQGVAFKTLLGNAQLATQRMQELSKFSAQTPFELPEIVNASKMLQAMTGGALAAGDGLRVVGDAASASGRSLEETSMWIGRLYAGLQSGTPVGEATTRLIEMGLISGTTARKLNELATSGNAAGDAFKVIQDTFGKFSGSMADQSQTFNGLWSTLKDTANMAMADIGKPLFDSLKGALESAIPFVEEFGKNASAALGVISDAWKNGQLGELIGLTIEAGFEIGVEAAGKLLTALIDWLSSGSLWAGVGNALLTSINEAMKLVGNLVIDYILVPLGAVASYVGDAFAYAFEGAVDFFASGLEQVINGAASMLGKLLGREFEKVSLTGTKAFQAPDFAKSLAENQAGGNVLKEAWSFGFDQSTQAGRELMGVGSGLSIGTGARDSLGKLIANKRAETEANKMGDWQGPLLPADNPKIINAKLEAQKLELAISEQLQGLNRARAEVESSWLMTSTKKYEAKVYLLEQEKTLLVAQRDELNRLANTPGISEADRMSILKDSQQVQGKIDQTDQSRMQMGPDPNSFGEQFSATLVNLQNQFGTVAQQMAQTFADVFNAATSSISTGIQGLIMGTMTWGDALRNIGASIVQSLVKSFADMVAGWIMAHVLMKGVSTAWAAFQSALRGKDVVEANATEAAKTPALAANATLASIGSFGVAAVIGIAAIAGILAAVGAFKEGGYTGAGDPNQVAGIVHKGEYVIPADAVSRIGLDTLESMRAGDSTGVGLPTSAASPSPITLNMGVFDNPARLNDWARSQDGRTVLVDIMRQHAHEVRTA